MTKTNFGFRRIRRALESKKEQTKRQAKYYEIKRSKKLEDSVK
jgi:hypothetical protein